MIHDDDVAESLAGLAGVYLTRDLYPRYVEVAKAAGRKPASITAYGIALSRHGAQKRRVQNRSAWFV